MNRHVNYVEITTHKNKGFSRAECDVFILELDNKESLRRP